MRLTAFHGSIRAARSNAPSESLGPQEGGRTVPLAHSEATALCRLPYVSRCDAEMASAVKTANGPEPPRHALTIA